MKVDLTIYLCPDYFVPVSTKEDDCYGYVEIKVTCPKCKKTFGSKYKLVQVTQETE